MALQGMLSEFKNAEGRSFTLREAYCRFKRVLLKKRCRMRRMLIFALILCILSSHRIIAQRGGEVHRLLTAEGGHYSAAITAKKIAKWLDDRHTLK